MQRWQTACTHTHTHTHTVCKSANHSKLAHSPSHWLPFMCAHRTTCVHDRVHTARCVCTANLNFPSHTFRYVLVTTCKSQDNVHIRQGTRFTCLYPPQLSVSHFQAVCGSYSVLCPAQHLACHHLHHHHHHHHQAAALMPHDCCPHTCTHTKDTHAHTHTHTQRT